MTIEHTLVSFDPDWSWTLRHGWPWATDSLCRWYISQPFGLALGPSMAHECNEWESFLTRADSVWNWKKRTMRQKMKYIYLFWLSRTLMALMQSSENLSSWVEKELRNCARNIWQTNHFITLLNSPPPQIEGTAEIERKTFPRKSQHKYQVRMDGRKEASYDKDLRTEKKENEGRETWNLLFLLWNQTKTMNGKYLKYSSARNPGEEKCAKKRRAQKNFRTQNSWYLPDVVSIGISFSSKSDRTIQMEELLKKRRTREPHPSSGVDRPIRI